MLFHSATGHLELIHFSAFLSRSYIWSATIWKMTYGRFSRHRPRCISLRKIRHFGSLFACYAWGGLGRCGKARILECRTIQRWIIEEFTFSLKSTHRSRLGWQCRWDLGWGSWTEGAFGMLVLSFWNTIPRAGLQATIPGLEDFPIGWKTGNQIYLIILQTWLLSWVLSIDLDRAVEMWHDSLIRGHLITLNFDRSPRILLSRSRTV
jgi:hypothetical protein